MYDLISRQAVIDALDEICERECEYTRPQRSVMCGACRLGSAFDVVDELPSAQTSLIEAVKIIEDFLHGCHDSLTSEIVTPDGIRLHTDWGYFEEGLEEIKRYAERRA